MQMVDDESMSSFLVKDWCNVRCFGCLVVLFLVSGCGGPKTAAPPAAADAVTEFREFFKERAESIALAPATAAEELSFVMESLAGKAEAYGEPFVGWLSQTREVLEKWGSRPKKEAVTKDLELLQQHFASP